MADWPTIASLATAAGTLVLAGATFSAVRSANRAARTAERSLLAGLRPLLMASRLQDESLKVMWQDRHFAYVPGGRAVVEVIDGVIYLAASLRNAGRGMAVLHGWYAYPDWKRGDDPHEPPESFRRLTRDLYIPPGDIGFWQGAVRESDDPFRYTVGPAVEAHAPMTVDILYGDHEGGQRTITRFVFTPIEGGYLITSSRYWPLDQPEPR
jgi:hypothetical protein